VQNAFVESFNGRLRDELLNETLFGSLPHCPRRPRKLVLRLQHRAASFEPGLADATGLRSKLARSERAMGQGALAIWRLRALSHCVGCSNHIQSADDSNFPWLKNVRQVRRGKRDFRALNAGA
jgi:hypothetical protein